MLMRALIVLLLVLNAGVAAWWWLAPEPDRAPPPSHPAGVPRLQLLSEAAPAPVRPTAAVAAAVPGAAPLSPETAQVAVQCVRLGPFADAAAAEAARVRLPQGLLAARVHAQAATRGAWNVVMPPQADPAAAQALAQRIDAAGFKDYYLIRDGADANGIALGRFGSADAAQRHVASLQAAGFPAQVRAPAGTTFWLDTAAGEGVDAAAAARAIGAAQVLPRACPEPA